MRNTKRATVGLFAAAGVWALIGIWGCSADSTGASRKTTPRPSVDLLLVLLGDDADAPRLKVTIMNITGSQLKIPKDLDLPLLATQDGHEAYLRSRRSWSVKGWGIPATYPTTPLEPGAALSVDLGLLSDYLDSSGSNVRQLDELRQDQPIFLRVAMFDPVVPRLKVTSNSVILRPSRPR